MAGEPVRGSWWSHGEAKAIHDTLTALFEHADVLVIKLVNKKRTLVHRRLWPAVLGVVTAREPWQLRRLTPAAKALLDRVDAKATLGGSALGGKEKRAAARLLEERLLVYATDEHTPSGKHVRVLWSWKHWAAERRAPKPLSPTVGKHQLTRVRDELGGGRLPW